MTDAFAAAERIADAILYEGYVLYPYRASAAKNQFRWQFGVVAPRPPHDDGEPWFAQTECIVAPGDDAPDGRPPQISVRVRCLRPARAEDGTGDGRVWLEGVPHAFDIAPIDLRVVPSRRERPLECGGVEAVLVTRTDAIGPYVKLELTLENRDPWQVEFDRDRDAMLQRALVGAHLLISIDKGSFVSLLEPPPAAAAAVAACRNRHTWPVLVGDRRRANLMLSSPIVLYDYPSVAAESRGNLCDGAEIDEILSLRILTLTDEEKREARATDPRARAILDQVEALSADDFAALHGTLRRADFFNPRRDEPPDRAFTVVGGRRIERGSRVRLRPNRRADAMDMFLRDQVATVAGVYRDVDDRTYVAVTVDADPAASLHESFGRFFYFDPAEVEPMPDEPGIPAPEINGRQA